MSASSELETDKIQKRVKLDAKVGGQMIPTSLQVEPHNWNYGKWEQVNLMPYPYYEYIMERSRNGSNLNPNWFPDYNKWIKTILQRIPKWSDADTKKHNYNQQEKQRAWCEHNKNISDNHLERNATDPNMYEHESKITREWIKTDSNVISILFSNDAKIKPGLFQHIEDLLENDFKHEPELNSS